MSELIQKNDNCATIRWKLLTSASALALTAYVSSMNVARADDTDRPLIWIELGGQAEIVTGQGAPFAPGFLSVYSNSAILQDKVTPLQAQKPPKFSFGEDGSISFQPEDSDWVFSAGFRIGRSSNRRHVDHQTNKLHYKYHSGVPFNTPSELITLENFADTKVQQQETHTILDFSVGKDVGLGMFGKDSSSTLSLGVRIAQFTSSETFDIRARPDLQFKYIPSAVAPSIVLPYFHTYHATGHASRSFRGVGPSLSWSGSAPFAGNLQNGEIALDWGVNAALLFGKQKARVKHQETGRYQSQFMHIQGNLYTTVYHNAPPTSIRSRSITVPNIGVSAGLSYRYSDAKISIGYRYDTFLQAMDTGIDAAKKSNVTFNGPYASISIGLGD